MTTPPPGPGGKGRRRRLARALKLPLLSGKISALVLVACLVLTAVLIPMVLRLERWIEYEIVLAVWWLIWAVTLSVMLYKRQRVSHDYQWREPRKWFDLKKVGEWFKLGDVGPVDVPADESCAIGCLILISIPVLIALAWLVIEVAVPAVAFLMYLLVRGMLANVANDWHGCQGNWLKAGLWGTIWATVYTAPLAFVVWVVHRIYLIHAAHNR